MIEAMVEANQKSVFKIMFLALQVHICRRSNVSKRFSFS